MRITTDLKKIVPDLLYPARCPFCHEIAPIGRDACPECLEKLPYVREPKCRKCGKPTDGTMVFCEDCMKEHRSFDEGCAAFVYDDLMRETIRRFKNKGRKEYGEVLGRLLNSYARHELEKWDADLLVPIPVHRSKRVERGYNQAAVIAAEISVLSGIPMCEKALVRIDRTAAMRRLGAAERRQNLRGAFRAEKGKLTGPDGRMAERVILVDDIFTTGATMDACAAVLKEAGVQEVFFLTVCIGGGTQTYF